MASSVGDHDFYFSVLSLRRPVNQLLTFPYSPDMTSTQTDKNPEETKQPSIGGGNVFCRQGDPDLIHETWPSENTFQNNDFICKLKK